MRFARLIVLVLPALLLPRLAVAEQDVLKLADRLTSKALEDYDKLEFDSARQTLSGVISKLRDAGEDESPAAARVYMSLGMVYIAGFKDRNRGVQQFVEALKVDGTVQLDPERATPELQEAFDEALKKSPRAGRKKPPVKVEVRPTPPPPPVEETPEPPPVAPVGPVGKVRGLQHTSVDEAPPGDDVTIKVRMGSDVAATRVFLFYRGLGQEEFQSEQMTVGRGGEWMAKIPGDAMQGKSMQYYIEARDAKGRPAVASGSAGSPYIISILKPKSENRRSADSEDPLAEHKRRIAGEAEAPDRGFGRVFMNLMAGTGIGLLFQGSKVDVAYQYHPRDASNPIGNFQPLTVGATGVALAPLHGALEIGVNVSRHIGVSLIGRLEGTLYNNAEFTDPTSPYGSVAKVTVAPAGLARFRYTFLEGRFKPSVHVGIGGGYIRHVLDVTEAGHHFDSNTASYDPPLSDSTTANYYAGAGRDPKTQPFLPKDNNPSTKYPYPQNNVCPPYDATMAVRCYDSIGMGFVLAAVGASFYYDLVTFKNGGFGLLLDTDLIFAFGDQSGINLDIQLGIGAHFL